MFEDNELEQIRLKKIQVMLDQVDHRKHNSNYPIVIADDNFYEILEKNDLLVVDFWAP